MNDHDENHHLIGHHEEHAASIADGSLTESVEFDWAGVDSLEAVSELPQPDSERLAEALHAIMLWLLDRRLVDTKDNRGNETTVARALRSTAVKCLILGMVLTPENVGPKRLREAARLVGMDEGYLRRLARQIETRFKLKNPFRHK